MTDLDALPFVHDDGRTPNGATGRKPCRKHEWTWALSELEHCRFCGRLRDAERSRRGKSARRLGADQERRIERVYGPTKIGERGDPVDHIGRVWKWQSKATRSLPPNWLDAIDRPTAWRRLPLAVSRAWGRMAGLYGDLEPVVIRSYVRRGVPTRDWLFVDCRAADGWLGLPVPADLRTWWVIPGDWWLDHFGRDEEVPA